ncbi:MAG: alpha-L-glutamate ligase-like protein [Phycisphaerae bacterium]
MTTSADRRFWAWPWELKACGILGVNARNARLLFDLNPRACYPRVDDKALTKTICQAHGIPVPETYALVERFGDVPRLEALLRDRRQFVLKPARGAAGRGVLVVTGRTDAGYLTPGGRCVPAEEVRYHVATMLSGLYSLGGRPDRVIVEERIAVHPVLEAMAVGGTPDVRVIVHRGRPVMAMIRLPTEASGGRANLHQGAVGVGITLDTGRTFGGVQHDRPLAVHPDTGAALAGTVLPYWTEVLTIAAALGRALEMGYVGVDIVLDAGRGPVVLEANARPGLSVQIANRRGLLTCLERPAAATPSWDEAVLTAEG